MQKRLPFKVISLFPAYSQFKVKFALGLLLSSLFLNYQPTFGFPPIKQNFVQAEESVAQTQVINPAESPVTFQVPFQGYISTPFSSFHPGIDIAAGLGLPIKPIAKGTVTSVGYNFFGLGLVVEVDHPGGYHSLYAHLGKTYVTPGTTVDENSYLGEIGLTGHTSGPHTHLEVSKNGTKIDPRSILPQIREYPEQQDFVAVRSATPSSTLAPILTNALNIEPKTPAIEQKSPEDTKKAVEDLYKKQVEENMNNILTLSKPIPTPIPLPKGGSYKFNFSLRLPLLK